LTTAALVALLLAAATGCTEEMTTSNSTDAGSTGVEDCTQDALSGGDDEFVFTSAYRVVDGQLGGLCFGQADPTIESAWNALATISPREQLGDLALFGGYEPNGDNAADTLASPTTTVRAALSPIPSSTSGSARSGTMS
jgi:hypothetical protein